jgi:hypothetical protein
MISVLRLCTVMAAFACAIVPAAGTEDGADLREFRLGMRVDELPKSGYLGFACATPEAQPLAGWQEFARCAPDAAGRHEVRFRYDEAAEPRALINDRYEGTKVGGHPVRLSLLIGRDARLEAIVIETDPKARLYLRKKAFLFGPQAMKRYGEDGWSCTHGQPKAGEQPVGGVFLRERCEKATTARRYVLERELYRRSGEELKDFVSLSRLTILPTAATTGEQR